MRRHKQEALETAAFLRRSLDERPVIGLIAGTGLDACAEFLEPCAVFPYKDLPHFPTSTVEGHKGRLLLGRMIGRQVLAMQGRFHLYEGYSSLEISFPVRVMQELGVKVLIISNASGGLNLSFDVGDIMIISDHINLTGSNPLIGPNEVSWGGRFPEMISAYDEQLAKFAKAAGKSMGIPVREGVYVGLKGPSLETPAEMRFLRMIGGDAVGFSTISEVIAAVHGGMKVLGLSVITNINNPESPQPASIDTVIDAANAAAPCVEKIIRKVVGSIDDAELR